MKNAADLLLSLRAALLSRGLVVLREEPRHIPYVNRAWSWCVIFDEQLRKASLRGIVKFCVHAENPFIDVTCEILSTPINRFPTYKAQQKQFRLAACAANFMLKSIESMSQFI